MRRDPYSRYSALQSLSQELHNFSQECQNASKAESLSIELFSYARTNVTDSSVLKLLGQVRPTIRQLIESQGIDFYGEGVPLAARKLVEHYKSIADQINELTPRFEHMVQFKTQLSETLAELRQILPLQTSGDGAFIGARAANAFSDIVEYSVWVQRQLRLHEDEEHKLTQLIEAFLTQCDATKSPERIASAERRLDRLRVLYLLEEVN